VSRNAFQTVRRTTRTGGFSPAGTATLILDFVPSDPATDFSLRLDFLGQAYVVHTDDPVQAGAYINLQVWK